MKDTKLRWIWWCIKGEWELQINRLYWTVWGSWITWRYWSYVPEDEFDPCLNLNGEAMAYMPYRLRCIYVRRITWRRHQAHLRDLERK